MQRPVRRHRYPQKNRNIPRILLLVGLPLLLIFLLIVLLIGRSGILTKSAPNNAQDAPHIQAELADHTEDLAPDVAYPSGTLPDALVFDRLVLAKSERRLTAYADGKPVRVYLVALGESPHHTPEGAYSISGKHADSAYHKSLDISYPNDEVKIHGLTPEYADVGRFHRLTDWTFGGVAVTNEEIEELFRHTPVDTPIDILP